MKAWNLLAALSLTFTLASLQAGPAITPAPSPSATPGQSTFASRCSEAIEVMLKTPINSSWYKMKTGTEASITFKWHTWPVAARLGLPPEGRKEALDLFLKGLRLCDNSNYSPWSTTCSLATTLMNRATLPPEVMEAQKQLLEKWNYDCSAGTINMRLYLYTAGYLASELWPDFADSATQVPAKYAIDFRGKTVRSHSAEEIKAYCRDQIYKIFRQFTVQNLVEHDLVYFPCDLDAVKMLADYAQDPEMKKRATMVMDYFLLNLATDWNHGYDPEPYFREKYFGTMMGDTVPPVEEFGWLYFGTPRLAPLSGKSVSLPFCSSDGYRMPPAFEAIARDREAVREKRESQFDSEEGHYTVWKNFFHSPDYTLSTGVNEYDGNKGIKTALFKEQRLLNLTWFSGKPGSRFFVFQENICQPYMGKTEKNDFGVGENPYSRLMQDKRTVIGIYDVPESYPYYKQYTAYRKNDPVIGQIEEGGWVFTHMGKLLFAFYSMMPTSWERNRQEKGVSGGVDVRWCDSRRNAWVLETAEASRYPGDPQKQLEAFAADVLKNGVVDTSKMKESVPEFSYKSIHGDTLHMVYTDLGKSVVGKDFINNIPVDYRKWKTLDSPWAQQEFNSPVVTVDFAGKKLIYDFDKWTVEGTRQ